MFDEIGTRIKENYENRSRYKLTRRTPVIIRIDGRAFHTFTKDFDIFDHKVMNTMRETMMYLCKNIQGCVLGHTQSDEISLLLIDYKRFNSDAWFDYNIQKVCSISASMATLEFNRQFKKRIKDDVKDYKLNDFPEFRIYLNAIENGAMFDSRCFNIPKDEVTNYFYWRQLDAMRNSVEMVAQKHFHQSELYKKSQKEMKEMLLKRKGIHFDVFYPDWYKRGSCCIRKDGKWEIDYSIPYLKMMEENTLIDY